MLTAPVRYIDRRRIAELLGVTPAWLDRNIKRLRKQLGFPEPVRGMMTRKQLYDPVAFAAWQAVQRGAVDEIIAQPEELEPAGAGDEDADRWARELDRRARAK